MVFGNIINFFEKGKGPWDITPDKSTKEEINPEQKIENFLKKFLKEKKGKKNNNKPKKNPKIFITFLIITLFTLWLLSGIYKINYGEYGAVSYFGKFYSITNTGLNFYIPSPIGNLQKISTTKIYKEKFNFFKQNNNFNKKDLILTKDENILYINFEVQWKIKNIENYLFNIRDIKSTIRELSESTMQEIIAQKTIGDILSDEKLDIEQEIKNLLQKILNSYNSGIEIVLIQILKVEPPEEVADSFKKIEIAKTDKEIKIKEAEGYETDLILKAKSEAEKIIKEAEGYKKATIVNAEGQALRFDNIYNEYKKAKNVTKKRIYLETMEEIYSNTNKIIIDEQAEKNIVPYLSLENINNN